MNWVAMAAGALAVGFGVGELFLCGAWVEGCLVLVGFGLWVVGYSRNMREFYRDLIDDLITSKWREY